ncbi:hypothetical protein [uncultured Veillonella sp.]|uniref:hypothetical protein n=1 Tax=uncultured Veillonella sp. TaxID=159268 RepID=UPI0028061B23|nr:hypothetical protein [uncultured Veillonella sp.]
MSTYEKIYKTYETYMTEADEMIRKGYETKRKPEYEEVDILRGKLLLISEITSNEFISKKAKEKASELAYAVIDI